MLRVLTAMVLGAAGELLATASERLRAAADRVAPLPAALSSMDAAPPPPDDEREGFAAAVKMSPTARAMVRDGMAAPRWAAVTEPQQHSKHLKGSVAERAARKQGK